MRVLFALSLLITACNGAGEVPEPKRPTKPLPNSAADSARIHALDSVRLGNVPAGTFGPYVADTASGGVATWAAQDGNARSWFAVAFDAGGKANVPVKLGPAPAEVGLAVLEPASLDGGSGFVLLDTKKDGERTLIEAQRIGARGQATQAPSTIAEPSGVVIWLDLVATTQGALALWAVRQADGAELFAAPVPSGPAGERPKAESIAKEARAWQAAQYDGAAAVGLVLPVAVPASAGKGAKGASDANGAKGGRVEVALLSATGSVKDRVAVQTKPGAESDLDMVAVGRGLVLAWSDHGDVDSRVMISALDAAGKVVKAPAPAVTSLGEQALVRLVSPAAGKQTAFLAWESLQERPARGRSILLAPVSADGNVGDARAELHHASVDSVPELTATARGLAALTLAPACRRGQDCSNVALVPTFVELDPSLKLLASEPVRMTALGGEPPDLAWGLSCARPDCFLLAAQATDPAPVYSVRLSGRWNEFEPAGRPVTPQKPPRAVSLEALAAVDPLADVASARLGTSTLAAWVTYFDPTAPYQRLTKPAPDGKLEPTRALLQVRARPETGDALPVQTISLRARSLGGVSLAAIGSGSPAALLGWTALDAKLPQVFVTVLDDKGKKGQQRMLTRAPGEKSDVAVVGSGDGWLVAWVDERSGDPELYSARVNRLLQSVGPEKRVTSSKGGATDVALLARGSDALVAWSDTRDAPKPGWGDIYIAKLKGADGSAAGPEQLVAKTPLHSRSPVLGGLAKSVLLAWIEEAPAAAGGSGEAEIKLMELDDSGNPAKGSSSVKLTDGIPTALAVDCEAERCRVVVSMTAGDHAELRVFDWAPGSGATSPVRLIGLTGPSAASIPPALLGREIVVADRSGAEGRVRRVLVDWR